MIRWGLGLLAALGPWILSVPSLRAEPTPPPLPAQVQSWIQQASDLQKRGAYAQAAALWQQVVATMERERGAQHPDTLAALNNVAALKVQSGAYAEAEPLYRRVLEVRERLLGSQDPRLANTLNNLADLFYNQGLYARAEPLYRRALAIREQALGPNHPDTALALNNLAALFDAQGLYARAEPLLRRALAIREKALGPGDPATASSLNNLAALFDAQGLYAKAEPLYRRALTIQETALGPSHPLTAGTLNNLALLLANRGLPGQAEPLYRRALAIREQVLGPTHPATAVTLSNLALLLQERGLTADAQALFERSVASNEAALGPDHPNTATSLNNLALLFDTQGLFSRAEPLYERVLAIREKALGRNHPETANALNNLAGLARSRGDFMRAEPSFRRALAIREQTLGPSHPETAVSLANLSELLSEQGRIAEAEPPARRALAIREQALGPSHPGTATSLSNLAVLLERRGETAQAEALQRRALAIRERALGPDHPDTALSLNNLALALAERGAAREAEPLLERALGILQQRQGPDHPDTARTQINLAVLQANRGAEGTAVALLQGGIRGQTLFLQRELPLLPEAQRQIQIRSLGGAWEAAHTFSGRSAAGTDLALFTRLNRHGLLQDIERRQALLARAPGPQQTLSQQIAVLTARLAAVGLSPTRRLALQEQRRQLEQQLYRQLPALAPRLTSAAQVARALPADGVLVEFQRFRPYDGRRAPERRWGEPRYQALVLLPTGSTSATDLGPASAIEPLIRQALAVSEKGERPADPLWQQVGDQVLAPLLPQLAGRRRWFLSPDAELNRIPFAALPDPRKPQQRLVQNVQLRLLTSGRDLLPVDPPSPGQRPPGQRPLVVAAPEFGGDRPWAALPASAQEGQQVAVQLNGSLIEGPAATAAALAQARGPKVLHVASHGFFLPSGGGDPLLDSGLVLAGANRSGLPNQVPSSAQPAAGSDDGYLTAKEAAQMQLEGTQLVVLSACDTGTGTALSGEGVYGLQRSLTVAGARSTLLSLWKVDDAATAQFMRRYYSLLKTGRGRMEALVLVQEEFRTQPPVRDWRDHKYWAAWQLSGEDTPLPGL